MDFVAGLEDRFPQTRHWFEQARGIRIDATPLGLVPDWSTVAHPRVLRRDTAGQRLMPRLPLVASGGTRVALDGQPDLWVRTTPQGARPVAAEVVDGLVIYRGAYPECDLVYKLTPTHVDEYVVVPHERAPHDFRYRLEYGPGVGLISATAEQIEIYDRAGVARLRLERPFARDSKQVRREGTLELVGDVLTLRIDTTGLAFPILVDPDWTTTGRLTKERFENIAVTLPGGEVIAPGGCTLTSCPSGLGMPFCSSVLDQTERYRTASGTCAQRPLSSSSRRTAG